VTIYELKPAFQNLLRPSSNWLAKYGITPNAITTAAILISLLIGIAIALYPRAQWPLLCLPIALLLRMILNALDGMLAREHHLQTALGTFLNELGDVLSDIFLYLPFCLLPGISASLIISIVLLAILSEMAGVVAVQVGSTRRYDGPMGKSDRAFVFGTIGLLLGLGVKANTWLNLVWITLIFLLCVTVINRIIHALAK
jgi:CDP-diacylglycerol---glycerol-3-phosphate 3-phosphatidyltransferase